MTESLLIAQNATQHCYLLSDMVNRHGLISGATGTGKTVTLQRIVEQLSRIGVPVFVTDIKGDLSGIAVQGQISGKLATTLSDRNIAAPEPHACPVTFWDVFGEQGHPVRATISSMGPLLIARMLDLNEIQSGLLALIFKIADDNGLLLLDLKDLHAMVQFTGENASKFTTTYGNISAASIGAIQRALLQLEMQGAEHFFGEPMLNINDLMQTINEQGVVNLLSADKLMQSPRLYSTFLLWLLSDIYEKLPEVGDLEQPKMALFFDEAHLIFNDAPKALLERIELVVRLIRSKGIGIFFATQNPLDIPQSVLGQLSNRVQHTLRAFSAQDQKAVKAIAQTMPLNPELDISANITEMATGEALISFLDEKGKPSPTQRAYIIPPGSSIGAINTEKRKQLIDNSLVAGVYEQTFDRESAYEHLKQNTTQSNAKENSIQTPPQTPNKDKVPEKESSYMKDLFFGSTGPRGKHNEGLIETAAKTAIKSMRGNGKKILRGILGSLKK